MQHPQCFELHFIQPAQQKKIHPFRALFARKTESRISQIFFDGGEKGDALGSWFTMNG
jgi:hypothetical protein